MYTSCSKGPTQTTIRIRFSCFFLANVPPNSILSIQDQVDFLKFYVAHTQICFKHFCNASGCTRDASKRCAKCGVAKYCSRECQVSDWHASHTCRTKLRVRDLHNELPASTRELKIRSIPDASFGLNDLQPLPADLDFVAHGVPTDSHTGKHLLRIVQQSLPGASLESIRRFGNRRLWERYSQHKATLAKPNAHLLFHGTREHGTMNLILGSGLEGNCDGFDFRRAAAGAYGVGAYFAGHAAYPVHIHPKRSNGDGTFTLIVAEVALGEVHDMGHATNQKLRLPPEKRSGLAYDSVCGLEDHIGSKRSSDDEHGKQFVVYEKNQAYPHFVIVVKLAELVVADVSEARSVSDAPHHSDATAGKDELKLWGVTFQAPPIVKTANGLDAWDLSGGWNNGFTQKISGAHVEGQYYTHAYWVEWRAGNAGWRTLLRHENDHDVLVKDGGTELGMYSNRDSNFRGSGHHVKPGSFDVVVVTGQGESASSSKGTSTFYINGTRVGTADRVACGMSFHRIGWVGQGAGLLHRIAVWGRVLSASEVASLK